MKRRDWFGAALAVVLTLPACGAAPTQPEEISPQARAYPAIQVALGLVDSDRREGERTAKQRNRRFPHPNGKAI